MTTINNLSIKQMREIVRGAPEGATHIAICKSNHYYRLDQDFEQTCWSEKFNDWVDSHIQLSWEFFYNFKLAFALDDLRNVIAEREPKMHLHLTSNSLQGDDIAEHDEFKVGDLVVYHSLPHKRLFKVHNKGGDSIVIRECCNEAGARCFTENSPYVDIRHATPSESKAGHRLEAERHE